MAKRDVVRLLVRLYGDPKVRERFDKDAAKVMKAAKLSAKERELLASGDAAKLRKYLGDVGPMMNIIQSKLKRR